MLFTCFIVLTTLRNVHLGSNVLYRAMLQLNVQWDEMEKGKEVDHVMQGYSIFDSYNVVLILQSVEWHHSWVYSNVAHLFNFSVHF